MTSEGPHTVCGPFSLSRRGSGRDLYRGNHAADHRIAGDRLDSRALELTDHVAVDGAGVPEECGLRQVESPGPAVAIRSGDRACTGGIVGSRAGVDELAGDAGAVAEIENLPPAAVVRGVERRRLREGEGE